MKLNTITKQAAVRTVQQPFLRKKFVKCRLFIFEIICVFSFGLNTY